MENRKIKAFNLPRMKISEKYETDVISLLNGLKKSKLHFSIFQDEEGELKVLHSEINEELFALLIAACHRNVIVFELYKLILTTIEKFREEDINEATHFMNQSVEYIKIKYQNKFL